MIGAPTRDVQPIDFWLPILTVFVGNTIAFIYCSIKKDNSYIDVFWSLTFMTPVAALLIYYAAAGYTIYPRVILTTVLVSIWGLRLSYHIGIRHTKEDYRYVDMRNRWTAEGFFYLKAFMYVFMLQGLFSLVTNSATLYIVIFTNDNSMGWTAYTGAAIWVFGFLFETIGDHQLKVHLADKSPNKKKFIDWGLWRYTRHPNYFGECVLWWGIWIIACGIQWGFVTVFAPLFISLLIRFVSGVPLLEAKYAERLDWKQYCHETNCFVPWFFNNDPNPYHLQKDDEERKSQV